MKMHIAVLRTPSYYQTYEL